ncbi:MAG: PEP-CTERM sorting domain-containing protein [Microcystaceae cyanobacterium]
MNRLFKVVLTTATLPLTWGLLTTESLAANFNVTVGDSEFEISAFTTSQTLFQSADYQDDLYSYDSTGNAIVDRSELDPGTSHLFFVNAIDGLGLFLVHDQPGENATGGLIGTLFNATDSKGDFTVLDDPDDGYIIETTIGKASSSQLISFQGWKNPYTDSTVLKWDYFRNDNPSLTVQFTDFNTGPDFGIPIEQWGLTFLSNAGDDTVAKITSIDFQLDQDITFTPILTSRVLGQQQVDQTQVPEPSTVLGLFLISGLGSLVSRKEA